MKHNCDQFHTLSNILDVETFSVVCRHMVDKGVNAEREGLDF